MSNSVSQSGVFVTATSLRPRTAPHKTIVLNPKGGSGKTTLSTNIASAYARRGVRPLLLDADPKGFAMEWLQRRPDGKPGISGMHFSDRPTAYSTWIDDEVLPPDCREMIIDLPAGLADQELHLSSHLADTILIPVMPSEIDVHAAARLIGELMIDGQVSRSSGKIGIVATRVKANTKSFQMLMRFLKRLQIPIVATLRDSQNFVAAAAEGLGVCDLPAYRAGHDASQVNAIVDWVECWRSRALTAASVASGWRERGSREGISATTRAESSRLP